MESERRVWRRCQPVGALSIACTFVDPSSMWACLWDFSGNQLLMQVSFLFILFIRFTTCLSALFFIREEWSSNYSVSMMLRIWLFGCILHSRSVVAHEGDSYSLVESFVVHLPSVGQVGPSYKGKHPLLVSFPSNVPSWIVEHIAY